MGSSDEEEEDYQHVEAEEDMQGMEGMVKALNVAGADLASTSADSKKSSRSSYTDRAYHDVDAPNAEAEEDEDENVPVLRVAVHSPTAPAADDIGNPAGQSKGNSASPKAKRARKRRSGKSKRQLSADEYFSHMDTEFVGRSNVQDDVFVYAARDVLIQKSLEVPILAQWPNTAFEYEFSADPPVVKFAIAFINALSEGQTEEDLEIESVFQRQIVDTSDPGIGKRIKAHIFGKEVEELESDDDVESQAKPAAEGKAEGVKPAVKGAFSVDREGTCLFVFDVNDDWWLAGILVQDLRISYKITAYVPSFSTVDAERAAAAEALMRENDQLLNESLCSFNDCEAMVKNNSADIQELQEEIAAVEQALATKKEMQKHAEEAELASLRMLNCGYERMNGLCIRMLNKHLLGYVMGFLMHAPSGGDASTDESTECDSTKLSRVTTPQGGPQPSISLSAVGLVAKYWHQVFMSPRVSAAEPRVQYSKTTPDLRGARLQRAEHLARASVEKQKLKSSATAVAPRDAGTDHISRMLAEAAAEESQKADANSKRNRKLVKQSPILYHRNTTAKNLEIALAQHMGSPASKSSISHKHSGASVSAEAAAGGGAADADADSSDELPFVLKKSTDPSSLLKKIDMSTQALLAAQQEHLILLRRHKKSIKSTIKRWAAQFEKENGHMPDSDDKRDIMGAYYSEYTRTGKQLKAHTDKLLQMLKECNMTMDDLEGM